MPPVNVITELKPLTWRGTSMPCSGIDTDFEHRLVERQYYKVDGAGHEQTGLEPVSTRATLAIVNTAGDPTLYPGQWQKFRKLLTDGLPGDLIHPDLGRFYARVKRFSFRLSQESTAGIFCNVEWVQSLKTVETVTTFDDSKAGAQAAAKKADEAIDAMGFSYPDGMAEQDFFGMVQSVFDQGFAFLSEIDGEINKAVAQIDEMQDSIDRVFSAAYSTALSAAERDPIVNAVERWVLEDSLLQLRAILLQTASDSKQAARTVLVTTTTRPLDAATLALEIGADVGSILELNASAATRPIIPKGTKIKYYAAA